MINRSKCLLPTCKFRIALFHLLIAWHTMPRVILKRWSKRRLKVQHVYMMCSTKPQPWPRHPDLTKRTTFRERIRTTSYAIIKSSNVRLRMIGTLSRIRIVWGRMWPRRQQARLKKSRGHTEVGALRSQVRTSGINQLSHQRMRLKKASQDVCHYRWSPLPRQE